jgi:antitoxin component of MazEF toxin-antitoxin module
MGFPTRVQLIKRKASEQWYINFPAALAQACEFVKGEVVEWVVKDRHHLLLKRRPAQVGQDLDDEVKKTP